MGVSSLGQGKLILLSCSLSFIFLVCPGFIRAYSLAHDFWLSYLVYFCSVLLLLIKFPQHKKTIALSFTCTLIVIIALLFANGVHHGYSFVKALKHLVGLPNLIWSVVACTSAYIFFISKNIFVKSGILVISLSVCIFYGFWGINLYINYLSFGTIYGKTEQQISVGWVNFINADSVSNLRSDDHKILLLDFFSTGCGVCFKKFPIVQKTYEKYKNNSVIAVYAVNVPWERDTSGQAIEMIRQRKYTFPVLLGKKKLDSVFGIEGYPTTIIVRGNTIVFKGDIDDVDKAIEEQLKIK